jgi:hypothetical protein
LLVGGGGGGGGGGGDEKRGNSNSEKSFLHSNSLQSMVVGTSDLAKRDVSISAGV